MIPFRRISARFREMGVKEFDITLAEYRGKTFFYQGKPIVRCSRDMYESILSFDWFEVFDLKQWWWHEIGKELEALKSLNTFLFTCTNIEENSLLALMLRGVLIEHTSLLKRVEDAQPSLFPAFVPRELNLEPRFGVCTFDIEVYRPDFDGDELSLDTFTSSTKKFSGSGKIYEPEWSPRPTSNIKKFTGNDRIYSRALFDRNGNAVLSATQIRKLTFEKSLGYTLEPRGKFYRT